MNHPRPIPCAEWEEKLAATYPGDLLPTEREELNAHIASCPACEAVLAEYYKMDTLIRDALIAKRSLQLWEIFLSPPPEQQSPDIL